MECVYSTMSPSEVVALIKWLPDDSAFVADRRGGREFLGWTWDRTVRTLHLESSLRQHTDFVRAHSTKEARRSIKDPPPIQYPGRPEPKPKPDPGSFTSIVKALGRGMAPPKWE